MIPILYQTVTEGTVPSDYGIGALTDCLACSVTEERNGSYELTMSYASSGIHADEIQVNRIIKAKPNFTDNPQLFRIYKVGKNMNGRFEVNAQHITYDLSGKIISSGTASTCATACTLLTGSAGSFNITTTKTVTAPFKITEPSSVRSWFGGKAGSLLDVYGTGEWQYDNFGAELKLNRGADRGVTIRYGKNLTELSQEIDIQNLATAVQGYYKAEDGTITTGTKISTGLTLDYTRDLAVDFSDVVDIDSATPIATQLDTLTNAYITNNQLGTAFSSITLNFVQNGELKDRVDLCDTVHIYFEPLGISVALKCIKTVWDCLAERYTSCTFGDSKTNITDTIISVQKEVADKPSASMVENAAKYASDLISGNLGGYVLLHDENGDGKPDEILILDNASGGDISQAVDVWRWNKNGLGHSSNGYAGPYDAVAITYDGKINASSITTGVLNADLLKAGVISDVNGKSEIDLTTGIATLYQLLAKAYINIIDADTSDVLARLVAVQNGGWLVLKDRNNQESVSAFTGGYGDGVVDVGDGNGNVSVSLVGLNGHIEQKNGAVSLWTGTLYNGNFDIPLGKYTSFLFKWRVSTNGNYMTMVVPRTDITNTQQSYQFNTEAQYYSFGLYSDTIGGVESLVVQFISRSTSSTAHICAVYGIY